MSMIHILFVPGTFGTTIQYILRQFNTELLDYRIPNTDDMILSDGSMHSFVKTGHYSELNELTDYLNNKVDKNIPLTSPVYPTSTARAKTIINLFIAHRPLDNYIFIYVDDIDQAEITILAQYYKISTGALNLTINNICGDNSHNIVNWNPDYTHWSQMQPWELREWFSMFYTDWVQEWLDAKQYILPTWLTISSKDILENTRDTFLKIINYAGTFNNNYENEFNEFIALWRSKQQYLLDEHNIIKNIVKFTISNTPYTWQKLNIFSEAIVQKRLKDQGYDLKCYNLNEFPTSAIELHKLLII